MENSNKKAEKILKDRKEFVSALQVAQNYVRCNWGSGGRIRFLEMFNKILIDEQGHYVAFASNDPKSISFAAKPEHQFDLKKRTKTTFGRFVRRHLEIHERELDDGSLHTINNIMIAEKVPVADMLTIVRGRDIMHAYRDNIGIASCMSSSGNWEKTKLYGINPERIGMAIYENNNARALIWETDCGQKIIDKVYSSSGEHTTRYDKWAREQGFLYVAGSGSCRMNGNRYEVTLDVVDEDGREIDYWPYLDTFMYGTYIMGEDGKKKLVLSNQKNKGTSFFLRNTDGGLGYLCMECGDQREYHRMHTHTNGNLLCEYCWSKYYRSCSNCNKRDIKIEETKEFQNSNYCFDCYEKYTFVCPMCRHRRGGSQYIPHDSDDPICYDCFIRNTESCQICRKRFGQYYKHYATTKGIVRPVKLYICNDCGGECTRCKEVKLQTEMNRSFQCNKCTGGLRLEDSTDRILGDIYPSLRERR